MCRIPISDIATSFHDSYFSRLFVFSYCRTVPSVKSRNVINEFNLKLNWRTRAFSLTSNLLHARATCADEWRSLRYYETRFVMYLVITDGINLPALDVSGLTLM